MTRALLIVDTQVDFCEGGALAVAGGNQVAEGIARFLDANAEDYAELVVSQDWHAEPPNVNGGHFALDGNPDFVNSWPVHCVEHSRGSDLHAALDKVFTDLTDADLSWEPTVVRKGQGCPSYSAFEGVSLGGRSLLAELRAAGITDLDVCGIATDHCVRATVMDALGLGFRVNVLTDLCAGVSEESTAAALEEMARAGAKLQ